MGNKTQAQLIEEYEKQQTPAGQFALELKARFAKAQGKHTIKKVCCMTNEITGQRKYFEMNEGI